MLAIAVARHEHTTRPPAASAASQRALCLLIAYKLTKASVQLLLALVLLIVILEGRGAQLGELAVTLREHATEAWSAALARALLELATPHWLKLAALGLGLDGVTTMTEGIALAARWRWGPWFVIAVTAALLPFELVAIVHHPRLGRIVLLVLNLLVVLFLVQRARREAQAT